MAKVSMSNEQAQQGEGRINLAAFDALTEEEVEGFVHEDGTEIEMLGPEVHSQSAQATGSIPAAVNPNSISGPHQHSRGMYYILESKGVSVWDSQLLRLFPEGEKKLKPGAKRYPIEGPHGEGKGSYYTYNGDAAKSSDILKVFRQQEINLQKKAGKSR